MPGLPMTFGASLEDLLADEQRRKAAEDWAMRRGGMAGDALDAMPYAPGRRTVEVDGETFDTGAPISMTDRFRSLGDAVGAIQQRLGPEGLNRYGRGMDSAARVIAGIPGEGIDPLPASRPAEGARQAAAGKPAKSTDPTSAESKRYQEAFKAQFPDAPDALIGAITEENFDSFRKTLESGSGNTLRRELAGATIDEQRERRKQDASQFAQRLGLDYEKLSLAQQQAMDAAAERERKAAKEEDGQTVPAGEAASIGQSRAALAALDVLESQFKAKGAAGVGGKAAALLPWDTDPAKYEDDVLAAAQAVGTILEGGKLAAGDEVKYRKLFPKAGDSLERGQNKLDNVRRLVGSLTDAKVEALDAAGYKVEGFRKKPESAQPPRKGAAAALPADASGQPTLDTPAKVRVRQKSTGKVKDLTPEAAAKVLANPDFEKVQ